MEHCEGVAAHPACTAQPNSLYQPLSRQLPQEDFPTCDIVTTGLVSTDEEDWWQGGMTMGSELDSYELDSYDVMSIGDQYCFGGHEDYDSNSLLL